MSNPADLQAQLTQIVTEILLAWDADRDSRVGKMLSALAGFMKGYRADIDAFRAALAAASVEPPRAQEGMKIGMKIWSCKVGEISDELLPDGSDLPMRQAVRLAYLTLTGQEPEFMFTGWGATLDEGERAVLKPASPAIPAPPPPVSEDDAPSVFDALTALTSAVEHCRPLEPDKWLTVAPYLYLAHRALSVAAPQAPRPPQEPT